MGILLSFVSEIYLKDVAILILFSYSLHTCMYAFFLFRLSIIGLYLYSNWNYNNKNNNNNKKTRSSIESWHPERSLKTWSDVSVFHNLSNISTRMIWFASASPSCTRRYRDYCANAPKLCQQLRKPISRPTPLLHPEIYRWNLYSGRIPMLWTTSFEYSFSFISSLSLLSSGYLLRRSQPAYFP